MIGIVGWVHGAAVLTLTAMAGNECCVAVFLEPVLRRSGEDVQRTLSPLYAGLLGKVMPFWYAASLLCTATDWWLTRDRLAGASALLQIAVLVFTLSVLVPINTRIAKGPLRPGWIVEAKRWDKLHTMRVAMLFVSAGVLVFGS